MSTENTAIFIGRFQPFHLGHLSVVDQIMKSPDIERVLIGVGSSQEANTPENPFSFNERKAMITETLTDRREKPGEIFGIPDVYNNEKWQKLVHLLTPHKFNVIYTGNEWVGQALGSDGMEIRKPLLQHLISGSQIRELIKKGQGWEKYLHSRVVQIIKNIKGVERITGKCNHWINPAVTADIILNYQDQGVVLIQRKARPGDPNSLKWAIPGGHIDYGKETVEEAAAREAKEETNLDITVTVEDQIRQYSEPGRDPRGHYVTMVYEKLVKEGNLHAGDDAVDIRVFPWDQIPEDLAFDHNRILKDYIGRRRLVHI